MLQCASCTHAVGIWPVGLLFRARHGKGSRRERTLSLQLIVDTAEMLGVPLFTAEALLRFCEWSKEALRIEWSRDPLQTCLRAGLTPPYSLLGRAQQQLQPQYGQHRTAAGRQGRTLLCSAKNFLRSSAYGMIFPRLFTKVVQTTVCTYVHGCAKKLVPGWEKSSIQLQPAQAGHARGRFFSPVRFYFDFILTKQSGTKEPVT